MKHKGCKGTFLRLMLCLSGSAGANLAVEVPLASNLIEDAKRAERACVPLLLEFATQDCGYCTLLEEEILKPMLRNREYDQRVLMRKLVMDEPDGLPGFTGELTDSVELAEQYQVRVTPTLLFVDAEGRELSERMVGISTLDYYGGYLDQALEEAQRKLRGLNRCD